MNKGRLFIISGPSGSGKDTVLKELFKKCPELEFSISSVTRPMRTGEKEGEKYNFISREKFESMIANDELLEYNYFVENYYGTPKLPVEKAINSGKDIIVEIDVNGAEQIRSKVKDAISVFIMPPSLAVLKKRLSGRGTETQEVIEKRIAVALGEIARANEYNYIVVNDDLMEAVNDFAAIISADRLKTERQSALIDFVLNK